MQYKNLIFVDKSIYAITTISPKHFVSKHSFKHSTDPLYS